MPFRKVVQVAGSIAAGLILLSAVGCSDEGSGGGDKSRTNSANGPKIVRYDLNQTSGQTTKAPAQSGVKSAARNTSTPKATATAQRPASTPTEKPAAQQPAAAKTTAKPTSAPPPPAPAGSKTVNGLGRRGAGTFSKGEAVIGYEISINGLKYRNCYFSSAPGSGSVSDGVINPWTTEVNRSACGAGVEDPDTVNGRARRGPGSFSAGEAVTGFFTIGNDEYRNCYLAAAPGNGVVSDGVINPWSSEVASACIGPVPVATPTPERPATVNGLDRYECPVECSFSGAALGAYIRLENGRECIGDASTPCYTSSGKGTIRGGVANPYVKEVEGRSLKSIFTLPATTPAPSGVTACKGTDPDTVNGCERHTGAFKAGEAVTGFFTINGRKYENCYLAVAPASGVTSDGVVNPWKGEVAAKACS